MKSSDMPSQEKTGNERYRISSYNRTRKRFTALIYAGGDIDPVYLETPDAAVTNEILTVTVPKMNKFTAIEFVKRNQPATQQ